MFRLQRIVWLACSLRGVADISGQKDTIHHLWVLAHEESLYILTQPGQKHRCWDLECWKRRIETLLVFPTRRGTGTEEHRPGVTSRPLEGQAAGTVVQGMAPNDIRRWLQVAKRSNTMLEDDSAMEVDATGDCSAAAIMADT